MASPLLKGPFTFDAYQRLGELGILPDTSRVELIDGQVVEMTPIGDAHAACVRRLLRLFARHLLDVAVIDVQDPVVLGEYSAPQPDVTLLKPRSGGHRRHPRPPDTLLVIEVADTTVAYDRNIKAPLYARADIPEMWLVNLPADCIETYRQPVGGAYTLVRTVPRGEMLSPLHFPSATFAATDILG